MTEEQEEAWNQIEKIALTGDANGLRKTKCPSCGTGLRFTYLPGNRPALNIACSSCHSRLWLDGVSVTPLWVQEVGNQIET